MTARLILARHGNTFGPNDKPVWVGASTDLPLVEKGIAQAHDVADALHRAKIKPQAVITGPLQRTAQTASIIAETLELSADKILIEENLREIDYGAWEGKSSDEIIAQGDGPQMDAWQKKSEFPIGPRWHPTDQQIIANLLMLVAQLPKTGDSIIITSNGILRFFAAIAHNAADIADRKVATGNMCVIDGSVDAGWHIRQWNKPPHFIEL